MLARSLAGLVLLAACNSSKPQPAPTVAAPPDPAALRAAAATKTFTDEAITAEPVRSAAATGGRATVDHRPGTEGRILLRTTTARAETSLTAEVVVKTVVSSYLGGLSRCYRTTLQQVPTAGGTLTLALAVAVTGQVSGTATGVDGAVAACVGAQLAGWKFPPPTQGGAPSVAAFELVFELAPE